MASKSKMTRLKLVDADTCPTVCYDDGCDFICHEAHEPRRLRQHKPRKCPALLALLRPEGQHR